MYVRSEVVPARPSVKLESRVGVENLPNLQPAAVWAPRKFVVAVTTPFVIVAGWIDKLPVVFTTVPLPYSFEKIMSEFI